MMKATEKIPAGASATKQIEVTKDVTIARNDDDVPAVFATPMMIYLMECAAADAIQAHLPEGWFSVGVVVNVKHLAATPVGATVTARAEVVEINDNLVTFRVESHDGIEKIGEGSHTRAAIDVERFLRRVNSKKQKAENSRQ